MTALKIPEDEPIQAGMISGAIESAQEKIEGFNFDARHHVLEYDDVLNKHREIIYKKRKEFLEISDLKNRVEKGLTKTAITDTQIKYISKRKDKHKKHNCINNNFGLYSLCKFYVSRIINAPEYKQTSNDKCYSYQYCKFSSSLPIS
jgi:preprotein translocase subunit SecA